MASENVAPNAVWDERFQLPMGVSKEDALEFAETAAAVHSGLMSTIIRGEQGAEDIAWAARFIMQCAETCYRAAARMSP